MERINVLRYKLLLLEGFLIMEDENSVELKYVKEITTLSYFILSLAFVTTHSK